MLNISLIVIDLERDISRINVTYSNYNKVTQNNTFLYIVNSFMYRKSILIKYNVFFKELHRGTQIPERFDLRETIRKQITFLFHLWDISYICFCTILYYKVER